MVLHHLSPRERDGWLESLASAFACESSVQVAFVFGSFLGGDAFRDLDIAVWLDEPFSLLDVARLTSRLWAAVGRPAFELDVVPLNDAAPAFLAEVAEKGRLLVERHEGAALDLAVRARSDWLDLRAVNAINALEVAS